MKKYFILVLFAVAQLTLHLQNESGSTVELYSQSETGSKNRNALQNLVQSAVKVEKLKTSRSGHGSRVDNSSDGFDTKEGVWCSETVTPF